MLFLKKLEIYGFKTFSYKTSISFSSGITAIVGPNGSGKSNLIDAIKWVLGEQTPKRLRIKELSDLIYSGNSRRKLDFAEVTLTINNDPPIFEKFKDFPEIVITRRFYHTGESEFYLNQKPCRLKDIQMLLIDIGITPQTYAIIDQGEVSRFLEASSKEKKQFLNDLAGVSKFKVAEEETYKNLKLTEENLEKLNIILREIKTQHENLKIQAEEAKEYLTLRERLKQLIIEKNLYLLKITQQERQILELQIKELLLEKEKLEKLLEEIEKEEEKLSLSISEINKELKTLERNLEEKEKELEGINGLLNSLIRKKTEISHEIERERLKITYSQEKLQTLSTEKETLEKRIAHYDETLQTLKGEYERLIQQRETLLKEKREFMEKFKNIENTFIQLSKNLELIKERKRSAEKELENIRNEIRILSEELNNLNTKREKLKEEKVSCEHSITSNQKLIEECLKRKEEIELKITEHKDRQNSLLIEKQKIQSELELISEKLKFIEKILPPNIRTNIKNSVYLFDILLKKYKFYKEDLDLLENFLQLKLRALVLKNIRDLETMGEDNTPFFLEELNFIDRLKIRKIDTVKDLSLDFLKENFQFLYSEKEKVLLSPLGIGLFIPQVNQGKIRLSLEREDLLKKREVLLKKREDLEIELSKTESELLSLSKEHRKIIEEIKKIQNHLEILGKQLRDLELNLIKIEEQENNKKASIFQLENKVSKKELEIKDLKEKKHDLEEKIKEIEKVYQTYLQEKSILEKNLKENELKLFQTDQRLTQLRKDLKTLGQKNKETLEKIHKISEDLELINHYILKLLNDEKNVKNKIDKNQQKKKELLEIIDKIKFNLKTILQKKEDLEIKIKTKRQEKKEKDKIREKLEITLHNYKISLMEKRIAIETFKKNLFEIGYEVDKLDEIDLDRVANLDIKLIEKEIEDLKKRLSEFKAVNFASIREFEIISQKLADLSEQKRDLELSLKKLKNFLDELRDISRERIITTLDKVNEKLKEIFSHVFEGGEAYLTLTENDPLTAGLDIYIKLSGKNVKHLTTLSGGEKALCVIALLMAFYMVNPCPFCILDEIDAHLDEKNSLKFAKLVKIIKKNSQIILITHNPQVMKEADTLLGVTMEEKGVSKVVKISLKNLTNESRYLEDLTKHVQK